MKTRSSPANIISLGGVFITKLRFCNKNTSQKENYLAAHHDGGVMRRPQNPILLAAQMSGRIFYTTPANNISFCQ